MNGLDFETMEAAELGRTLAGIGVNLLSADLRALAGFLAKVFGLGVHRLSDDFAIVTHTKAMFLLHGDGTYGAHRLHALLPENPPRGTGAQFYLFGVDPDGAVARAEAAGYVVIEHPADKPHGLREATILSPEGYAFSPAVALK